MKLLILVCVALPCLVTCGKVKTTFDNNSMLKCDSVSFDPIDHLKTCIAGSVNMPELKFDLMGIIMHYDKLRVTDFFKKYCPNNAAIYTCLTKMTIDKRECFSDFILHKETFGNAVLHSIMNYMCSSNGDAIAHIIENNILQCFSLQSVGIWTCMNKLNVNEPLLINSVTPNLNPYAQFYDAYDLFHTCMVQTLSLCEPSTIKDTFDVMFHEVRQGIAL